MSKSITFQNVAYTQAVLEQRGVSNLATLFNLIQTEMGTNKPVSRFSDKVAGVRRTWALLEEYQKKTAPKVVKEKAQPKTPLVNGERKTRIKRFTFAPTNKVVNSKETGTLRAQCVELLKKGATFAQVKELVVKFDKDTGRTRHEDKIERRAYELVRIMHYQLGYGIKHDIESDTIRLITSK
jgi:hypothetical protein